MLTTPTTPASFGVTPCGSTTFTWGSRTYIMGIINLTPDSFSGDGLGSDAAAAAAQAQRMVADGADILDIGAESTRPGHQRVDTAEELRRLLPALRAIRAAVTAPISIDTTKLEVAAAALDAGADLINDQWGLLHEPGLAKLAADRHVPLALMHNQRGADYPDGVVRGVVASLRRSCEIALEAGVPTEDLIIDPGIGFGKSGLTPDLNLEVLRHLDVLRSEVGRPVLLGTSRKSFIARVLDLPPEERVEGTAATVALGIALGVDMVRVHDVRHMARAARMADALVRAGAG